MIIITWANGERYMITLLICLLLSVTCRNITENIWTDFEENDLDGNVDRFNFVLQIMPLIYIKAFELQCKIDEICANKILMVSL